MQYIKVVTDQGDEFVADTLPGIIHQLGAKYMNEEERATTNHWGFMSAIAQRVYQERRIDVPVNDLWPFIEKMWKIGLIASITMFHKDASPNKSRGLWRSMATEFRRTLSFEDRMRRDLGDSYASDEGVEIEDAGDGYKYEQYADDIYNVDVMKGATIPHPDPAQREVQREKLSALHDYLTNENHHTEAEAIAAAIERVESFGSAAGDSPDNPIGDPIADTPQPEPERRSKRAQNASASAQ